MYNGMRRWSYKMAEIFQFKDYTIDFGAWTPEDMVLKDEMEYGRRTHIISISIEDVYFIKSGGSLTDSLRESLPSLVESTW